ncbi:hypothetical protein GS399_03275 [Pedobacter sp. HMF7647]|uniref:YMGG-like Gly-zipper domain-containing protein n=1 Tax=Hufsiella arboris TaxID=2695275 RepID=A0A7K1Y6B4_9SPHI|nr:YMGG-like glycine zipper-containing protein [Hufsiella arboris]MXV49980.1 hypothetical protein [Hufsiella arboris]
MKKILCVIAAVGILAACNNNREQDRQAAVKAVKDSMRLDSFKRAEASVAAAKARQRSIDSAQAIATARARASSRTGGSRVAGYSQSYTNDQPAQQKKGWSSAAKGAAIGAGAGAITGIAVDKKDGRGAIVGGLVGAGTGYLIGRSKDKKTGRAQ